MTFDPERFFAAYAAAFATGTAEEIAVFYLEPCLTVRRDGAVRVFPTTSEVSDFFSSVLGAYRTEGMAQFVASNEIVEPLGGSSVRLTCDWAMQRADGSAIRRWRQTYVFQLAGDDWRIALSLIHAEGG